MDTVVYVPFVVSLVVVGLSRLVSRRLWPGVAAWGLSLVAATLSVLTIGALALLASPLVARLPVVAALGRWKPRTVAVHAPTPSWVSAMALVALGVVAIRFAREVGRLVQEVIGSRPLRRFLREGADLQVVVVDGVVPAAHAILTDLSGRGAVVMTSSMVDLLDAAERAAVVAHERSHLRQRHAVFTAVVRLAAALNPLLCGLRADAGYALERWADEEAAAGGRRAVLASALAKTALGMLASGGAARTAPDLAFHRLGVGDRVAALLDEPSHRSRPVWLFVACAAVAAGALAWAMHDTERFFEAARIWSLR